MAIVQKEPWQRAVLDDAASIIVDGGSWGRGNDMNNGKLGAAVIWADREIDRLSAVVKEYSRQLAAYEIESRSAAMRVGPFIVRPSESGAEKKEAWTMSNRERSMFYAMVFYVFFDSLKNIVGLVGRFIPEAGQ